MHRPQLGRGPRAATRASTAIPQPRTDRTGQGRRHGAAERAEPEGRRSLTRPGRVWRAGGGRTGRAGRSRHLAVSWSGSGTAAGKPPWGGAQWGDARGRASGSTRPVGAAPMGGGERGQRRAGGAGGDPGASPGRRVAEATHAPQARAPDWLVPARPTAGARAAGVTAAQRLARRLPAAAEGERSGRTCARAAGGRGGRAGRRGERREAGCAGRPRSGAGGISPPPHRPRGMQPA